MNADDCVYLDCAASAPVFAELLEQKMDWEHQFCANPSAKHALGLEAARLLDRQRQRAARLLDCLPEQLCFCSGATEANNLALYNQLLPQLLGPAAGSGATAAYSELDHPSSLRLLRQLKTCGLRLELIPLGGGRAELLLSSYLERQLRRQLEQQQVGGGSAAIPPVTAVVTAVDSDSGRLQDMAALSRDIQRAQEQRRAAGLAPVYIHADMSQYVAAEAGSEQLRQLGSLLRQGFDSIAISGQKIGAGRGGALLLQRTRREDGKWSFSQGGGQEGGLRSGTENLAAICALVRALELQAEHYDQQLERSRTFAELLAEYPAISLQPAYRQQRPELFSPFIFSIAAPPLPAEVMQRLLAEQGYMVGTGSACSSKMARERLVKLQAQGYESALLPSVLRVSFGNGGSVAHPDRLRAFLDCLQGLMQQYA